MKRKVVFNLIAVALCFGLCSFIFGGCTVFGVNLNIKSISITGSLVQSFYLPNEPINPSGLKIKVEYNESGSTEFAVTKAMIRHVRASEEGLKNISVFYGGKQTDFNIVVTSDKADYLIRLIELNISLNEQPTNVTEPDFLTIKTELENIKNHLSVKYKDLQLSFSTNGTKTVTLYYADDSGDLNFKMGINARVTYFYKNIYGQSTFTVEKITY